MPRSRVSHATPDKRTDTPAEGRAEFGIGVGLLAFGLVFYAMWFTDHSGHGEKAFLLLPAFALIPLGAGFMLGGAAVWVRLPGWRLLRWAPVVGLVGSLLSCRAFFP